MHIKSYLQLGQSMVELLLAFGLLAILLPALFAGMISSRQGKNQENNRFEAVTLLKEEEEAIRSIRGNGWTSFAINGTHHTVRSGNGWALASGSATLNGFTRHLIISDVQRNSTTGAIVASGGVVDPSTKQVDITISWNVPRTSSVSSRLYFTRYLENASYTETAKVAHFDAGTHTGTTTRLTTGGSGGDGEIILGAGGSGNWCAPELTTATYDMDGSGIANSIAATTLSANDSRIYAGTGENAAGLVFIHLRANETNITQLGQVNESYKTNGIFGETNYAYVTTNRNGKELMIIDLSNYQQVGWFETPNNANGEGIFVQGNIAFVTAGNKLYTIDLASKTGSRPQLANISLPGNGRDVYVVGNYAYIATAGSTTKLQIVEFSADGRTLTERGSATSSLLSTSAVDVFVNSSGTTAYLATELNILPTQHEFFIINTTTKTGTLPVLGSVDTGSMNPKALTVVPGSIAIVVGYGGQEYQVINVASETAPSSCGSINLDDNINDIASVLEADGDAYSYVLTDDDHTELRIIQGGPGGTYSTNGIFESQIFSAGYQTANNRFSATFFEPAGTDIRFQVSMANVAANGSCPTSGYTYVGPNGSTTEWFTPVSGEWVGFPYTNTGTYINPGSCFRYRVQMTTTDNTSTPVLQDVTINYSP